MDTVPVAVRVPVGLRDRLDAYARVRGCKRARVVIAACEAFLDDAQRAVPDLTRDLVSVGGVVLTAEQAALKARLEA